MNYEKRYRESEEVKHLESLLEIILEPVQFVKRLNTHKEILNEISA